MSRMSKPSEVMSADLAFPSPPDMTLPRVVFSCPICGAGTRFYFAEPLSDDSHKGIPTLLAEKLRWDMAKGEAS